MKTTLNGVEQNYIDAGKGAPLVFVHGFPLSSAAWQKQIDAFQSTHRVIALDLRGFGGSDARPGPVAMAQYAVDLRELLDQLAVGPVVLIGHSMGGYVALAFAREFPELLRGLTLVGTKAGNDTPEAAAGRRTTAEQVKTHGIETVISTMLTKMLGPDNHDARMIAQVREIMSAAKPVGVVGALLGMAERPDSTPSLKQIAVPTLIVAGAADTVIPPAESEKLARDIRGAELKLIPGAGHLVAYEQPEKFNRILKEWLMRAMALV